MHHGFVRVSPVFVINGQPPEVLKPGEGAFDNPSFWHVDKSVRPPESVSAQGICISWIRAPLPPLRCHGR